jgi:SAM-dependent methyltransferase
VQFWLRRGVSRLQGIDVNSLAKRWATIVPELKSTFGTDVEFRQASIEKIPFKDEEFDLVASSAVVEHVRNIEAMVAETARVLRPGGWAWHDFGPLYFTFGGDHCIAAFGPSAGYDHLLLNEDAYRARLADQAFFDKHEDPNLPFWARKDQFSFLEPSAYLQHFARHFEVAHVVVKISRDALRFRKEEPRAWKQLLDAGLSEATLLTSGLAVILKKR